ncbi:MAG TPA: hypothetical protein VGL80_25435 [Pseudonocardiaceae bacterium]
MTIPEDYREFFVAAAGASGALIGLLFVAVSVFPERARRAATRVEYHTRASTALVVFTNALVLSLTALVPNVDLGWWTLVMGIIVFAFAAATARLIVTAALRRREHWSSLVLVAGLLVIAVTEFITGIRLIIDDTDLYAIHVLDYLVIVDVLVGIARAWQLVNMRDTGLLASLRVLAHGDDLAGEADDERDTPPSE